MKFTHAAIAAFSAAAVLSAGTVATASAEEYAVGQVAPAFANSASLSELQGQVIHITLESPLVLDVADPVAVDNGAVTTPGVAQFEPGYADDVTTFNPAFVGLAAGSTTAVVKDPETGKIITFTLVVDE
ncbi:MAG: hypothetical protein Q3976_01525 [Corynebacterium sp.]|nr:hypothetical protein [Corynebacterium sp.]